MSDTKVKEINSADEWIARLRSGSTLWFDEFYKENRDAFLLWGGKNHNLEKDELLDIYQNAMIILFENLRHNRMNGLQSSVVTYLYGIAKNLIFKHHRKNELINRHEVRLKEHYRFLSCTTEDFEKMYIIVSKALARMTEPCKSIIRLFYIEGLQLSAIADRLSYSKTDVLKTQKSRCLKKLRETVN